MRVKVLGKYWNLCFKRMPNHYGRCDRPDSVDREIAICAATRGPELLDTVIHEVLHAAGFHIDEEFVAEFATDLTKILRRKAIWERIVEQPKPRGRK